MAAYYITAGHASDLIKKFAELNHVNYNVKGVKREIKISPEDIRTELEDDEDGVKTEVLGLIGKYTVQVIFQQTDTRF